MDHLNDSPRRFPLRTIVAIVIALLLGSKTIAQTVIEYEWWNEMGQLSTWFKTLLYGWLPGALATLLAFVVLWLAHARALKAASTGLRQHRAYAVISTLVILFLGFVTAGVTVDSWTVVRFAGGSSLPHVSPWRDPVFQLPLGFYLFRLPFYHLLFRFVLGLSLVTLFVYWVTSRVWSLRRDMPRWNAEEGFRIDLRDLSLSGVMQVSLFRWAAALFLFALAGQYLLGRYDLLFEDHGSLTGIDWVDERITLPLMWFNVIACLVSAAAVLAGRARVALLIPIAMVVSTVIPRIVTAVYVRPSEITIQRPYIQRHIEATRAAYGLNIRAQEIDFEAKQEQRIDPAQHRALFHNVRLWDWRAFHDTVTQIQALRPYYVFHDSDVDRYKINGELRQVLITPRELDVDQLPPDARARWINPHFIYTHGYGLVMAEAARITPDGLPNLLVENAPLSVNTNAVRIQRPELYFGEVQRSPVFVRTGQPEFNYPSGAQNVESHYHGRGGFPISSPLMRLAAAAATGDWNIVLTSYLKDQSRMMIRRQVRERLDALAGFIDWDRDPYLVISNEGRLVWVVDGYTSSDAHPYSKPVRVDGIGNVNYVRNSVKATVDAYDGNVHLYLFDTTDPLIRAYANLFPDLFEPAARIPADLKEHLRYPETIFRIQAEIYRTYHMTDPEAFFNKEDVWDLARSQNGSTGKPEPGSPTYVMAALPNGEAAEFLLLTTFAPRNKDNLIGLMVARCDGDHLGELVFLQLPKQQLIFGPMQIGARINQDQVISKDLSMWNQQGSQVLWGQMLVLPIQRTFVYIQTIYLQASEARMPQLRKVVLAVGNRLIYTDTYEQAIDALGAGLETEQPSAPPTSGQQTGAAASAPSIQPVPKQTLSQVKQHLQRYRSLTAQGKFADAGKEMEAIEALLK